MALTAAAVRLMAEKGLSALDIADILEAMEPVRTANAERQARYRERRKGERNTSNVTRNVTPPNDIYSNPPEHTPSEAKASLAPKGKTRKASRLPEDWQPEALTGEIETVVEAWEAGALERELARFRDYWTAKSGRSATKQDWQAAWRYWLRNADEWTKNGRTNQSNFAASNGTGLRGNRPDPALDMWRQANAELAAEAGSSGGEEDYFRTWSALPALGTS